MAALHDTTRCVTPGERVVDSSSSDETVPVRNTGLPVVGMDVTEAEVVQTNHARAKRAG